MAKNTIYKVTIGKVTTENGTVCTDPIIKLIGYPNIRVNCIDDAKGIYKVQLPENTDISGLQFSVDCNLSNCPTCDTQIKEFYFCEDAGDCPDCNDCNTSTGFCEPRCESEFCLDDSCVECTTDTHCPCDQTCDENGNCGCPQGFYPGSNGCCRECDTNSDCGLCEICSENGTCIDKDCIDGNCDPDTGICEDCVTGDDCLENQICVNNECKCVDGYVFDECAGECVQAPVNPCTQNDDCGSCYECTNINSCTGYGSCTPIECPDGKVCYNGDCVDECNCANGNCNEITSYCGDAFGDLCGCIPCEGNCEEGCGEGCFCNESTNQCEGNPCANKTCSNGLDCGDGCGCLNGTCVPCESLNCLGTSCAEALGCGCKSGVCGDSDDNDGCNNEPCGVDSDCGDGCTCYEGACVSCGNFSCLDSSCADRPGCACQGNQCVGVDDDCTDTVTLEKDDDTCEIIGELEKENCCSCPKITLDVKGKRTAPISSLKTEGITFKVELRKGDYTSFGNINALPLLDDTFNRDIADNETPESGQVTLSYVTYYDVYDLNEDEDGKGTNLLRLNDSKNGSVFASSADQKSGTPLNFNTTSASITLNNIRLDKIGAEGIIDDEWWVIKKVVVNFTITKKFVFPNDCEYIDSDKITYNITKNNNYTIFSQTGFTAVKGNLLSTDDCRQPLFKWSKSVDNSFNEEEVIVKRYIDPSGVNIWTDILDNDDGADSCYYYNLDVDCNCDEPASDFIVFCNPSDIEFDLTNCNTTFQLKEPFTPCLTNQDNLTYFFQLLTTGGDTITRTFTYATKSTVIGKLIETDSQINKVRYGIYCNGSEYSECTKEYEVSVTELPYKDQVTVNCVNGEINALFADTVTVNSQNYTVDRIDISLVGGSIFTTLNSGTGWNKTLPAGTYNVKVYWEENCDPTEFVLQEDCCGGTIPTVERGCDGVWSGEYNDNYTYVINGNLHNFDDTPDLLNFLQSNYPADGVTINISNGNCAQTSLVFPSTTDGCCGFFGLSYRQNTNTSATVTVTGAKDVIEEDGLTFEAYKGSTTPSSKLPTTNPSPGVYVVYGYEEGDSVILLLDSTTCGSIDTHFRASTCNLNLALTEYPDPSGAEVCRVKAEVDPISCGCPELNIITELSNAIFGDTNLTVTYKSFPQGFSSDDISSYTYKVGKRGEAGKSIGVLDSGVLTIPYSNTKVLGDCYFDSTIRFSLVDEIFNGKQPIEIESIKKSGLHIVDDSKLQTIGVSVTNGTTTATANYNSVTKSWKTSPLFNFGDNITINVTIKHVDGGTYTGSITKNTIPIASINTFAIKICREQLQPFKNVIVDFVLSEMTMKDGCSYDSNPTISYNVSAITNQITPSGEQIVGLEPSIPANVQVPLIRWYKDDVKLDINGVLESGKADYFSKTLNSSGKYEYVLGVEHSSQGSTYRAVVECSSCVTEAQQFLSCLPDVDIEIIGDNVAMDVTLSGKAGGYVIDYDGNLYNLTVPDDGGGIGTETITIIGPLGQPTLTVGSEDSPFSVEITIGTDTLYIPSYTPLYAPVYLTPSYAPTYTPGYSPDAYTPTYAPNYTPDYVPLYAPNYTPNYATPSYTPIYAPSYATPTYITPTYQPAAYVPTYNTPNYAPVYTPIYAPVYTPIYAPNYAPNYTPGYLTPSYVSPTYVPIYVETYTPVYTPVGIGLTPAASPVGLYAPTYLPTYIVPSYATPTYTPIYSPASLACDGCEYLGVCCNEINNSTECENAVAAVSLEEMVEILGLDVEALAEETPVALIDPCTWNYGLGYCECTNSPGA